MYRVIFDMNMLIRLALAFIDYLVMVAQMVSNFI